MAIEVNKHVEADAEGLDITSGLWLDHPQVSLFVGGRSPWLVVNLALVGARSPWLVVDLALVEHGWLFILP